MVRIKFYIKSLVVLLLILTTVLCRAQKSAQPLWQGAQYILYADSIVQQNKYVAKALSSTSLTSNYQSPANEFKSANLTFKFSINGKDNEMKSGIDHHFTVVAENGKSETPLIKFGSQLNEINTNATYLAPNTTLKVRLDMRDVLKAFKEKGYYTFYNGEKLYKEDFKAVYIAGNTSPLIWDFNNLKNYPALELKDEDGDGIYETTLRMNVFEEQKQTASQWNASKNTSAFPQYSSGYVLSDALYNLALEEMMNAVEPDSTFRTGKEWAGVWTRDISYSIILSMAYLQPQVSKNSLLRKVNKKKKIIQDTGTGGAWPVSTDRMIWAVAAWELYKATGDKDWLQQAYVIVKNSLEDDYKNAYDPVTGMVKGESSFLDWREQSYPLWMQPADIFESENLGTNAVHFQANIIAGKMAALLNKTSEAEKFKSVAQKIKQGINQYLWQTQKGFYAQYLYGRFNKIASPRSEALGEALTVLFDIADAQKQKQIVSSTPVMDFGVPTIYPQIPGIPPYHNNSVWPFVQSYWLWAGAKAGNEKSVMESIAAIYRPAAMFLTNKENFVVENGDFAGTQINSSNMLWSLAGNISIVHKVLFGIHFNDNELLFQPFVPQALKGKRNLTNFKYRDAILNIEMEGFGNEIKSFTIDGKEPTKAIVPATLKGTHTVKIILSDKVIGDGSINKVPNYVTLATPAPYFEKPFIKWSPIDGANEYSVLKNGQIWKSIKDTVIKVEEKGFAEYTVIAVDKNGVGSFAGEPLMIAESKWIKKYEAEDFAGKAIYTYKGFTGKGFTEVSTTVNKKISIPVTIEEDGYYFIDVRYANGNGPINTENKCAIRTLQIDGKENRVFVLPQRGTGEWSNWGYSNALKVFMKKGKHTVSLAYLPQNENMNGVTNQAMIDHIRIIKSGVKK